MKQANRKSLGNVSVRLALALLIVGFGVIAVTGCTPKSPPDVPHRLPPPPPYRGV